MSKKKIHPRSPNVDMKTAKWFNDLYDSNMTIDEIVKETCYSRSCVASYIWRPRKRGNPGVKKVIA